MSDARRALENDLYPSRVSSEPALLERKDPIVYKPESCWDEAPIDRSKIERYERDGSLFIENYFAAEEIQEFREELDRLAASEEIKNLPLSITEPIGNEIRSIFAVHRISALFERLTRDPRLRNLVRFLLDDEVYIHQSRVNRKPGFSGREFFWHSDFETWHVEDGMPRMRAISCSIALTDNNPFNGPLMLMPGSHRTFVSCVGETPKDHYKESLKKQEFGVPDKESLTRMAEEFGIVAPTGKAGSVLFFECNTMHGSSGNISPWPRSNVYFVFNSLKNRLTEPFCGLSPRPDYIGSRDFDPLGPVKDQWW